MAVLRVNWPVFKEYCKVQMLCKLHFQEAFIYENLAQINSRLKSLCPIHPQLKMIF